MSIIVPNDRTCKQPARGYCLNPDCRGTTPRFEFESEHSPVVCPKCGSDQGPTVGLLVLIHFLYPNKQGEIIGEGGMHYSLACDSARAILATVTNQEAATGEISAVNCPGCLKNAVEKKLAKVSGWALAAGT